MKSVKVLCASLALASGSMLAERVIDPFDRHDAEYTLQGPQHRSEVFYMSVNEVDANGREVNDDRFGDALLLATGGLALTALLIRQNRPDDIATSYPAEQ